MNASELFDLLSSVGKIFFMLACFICLVGCLLVRVVCLFWLLSCRMLSVLILLKVYGVGNLSMWDTPTQPSEFSLVSGESCFMTMHCPNIWLKDICGSVEHPRVLLCRREMKLSGLFQKQGEEGILGQL